MADHDQPPPATDHQRPDDPQPQPRSFLFVQDEAAAIFRRIRRDRLLARVAIALLAVLAAAALLLGAAGLPAVKPGTPTTQPVPVTVPQAGPIDGTCVYVPVPAGTP